MANTPPARHDQQDAPVTDVSPPGGVRLRFVAYLIDALILRLAALVIAGIAAGIIRAYGAPLSFGRATARHFLKVIVTPMALLIDYLMAAVTARKRALHDVLADTLVIGSR